MKVLTKSAKRVMVGSSSISLREFSCYTEFTLVWRTGNYGVTIICLYCSLFTVYIRAFC